MGICYQFSILAPRMTLRGQEHRRRWAHTKTVDLQQGTDSPTTCLSQVSKYDMSRAPTFQRNVNLHQQYDSI